MFSLTIVFGPGPSVWQLLFKTIEAAEKACTVFAIPGSYPLITDDFGHKAVMNVESVHAWMIEDLEVSKMGHIELALHQARTQAKAQTMGQADPMLRAAGLMNAGNGAMGPAMLAPGFGRG